MAAYRHAVHECGLDGVALFVGPLATPPGDERIDLEPISITNEIAPQ